MAEARPPTRNQDGTYDVRLRGHLDPPWAERLGVPGLIHEADGITLLRGVAADQAVIHGLLQRVRDLGVPLISVIYVPAKEAQ
ncbi:MAG: hypothetical protein IT535_00100 [Bauldia sp.]|nr:hypothetical protein [Bauldia sp.]